MNQTNQTYYFSNNIDFYKDHIRQLEQQNAELLEVLKGEVIELANLAMMTDPEKTELYMTGVYSVIAKAEGKE